MSVEKKYAKFDKYRSEVIKSTDAFAKDADGEDKLEGDDRSAVRGITRLGKLVLDMIDTPLPQVIGHALSTGSAYLTYGSKCLSNLK